MSRLSGKVALITGGNSGIGLETARLFVAEGAKVVITGRRQEELEQAARSLGDSCLALQGDVSKLSELDLLFVEIGKAHGKLDIVFANAGLGQFAPLGEISEEHFDLQFNINVKGVLFTVQKALPFMKNGGSIILNASVAASLGMDAFSVYSATKAAVRSFARTWTSDLKSRRIRVNAISPGPIETPIFGKMGLNETQIKEFGSSVTSLVPMGRMGKSHEIAKAVLFLASDESSYVTGTELFVDGGLAQV